MKARIVPPQLEPDAAAVPVPLDVVETLLFAHVQARQMVAVAQALASSSATPSTAEAAASVERWLRTALARHMDDEELSLAPRLTGFHEVVDRALVTMRSDHFREAAMTARLAGLCGVLRRDVSMLHALRFPLAQAVAELAQLLAHHQALEESILFPALRRFLKRPELAAIDAEMHSRRGPKPLAALN